jgi:uncharacterized protein YecE (DUF72 family)
MVLNSTLPKDFRHKKLRFLVQQTKNLFETEKEYCGSWRNNLARIKCAPMGTNVRQELEPHEGANEAQLQILIKRGTKCWISLVSAMQVSI